MGGCASVCERISYWPMLRVIVITIILTPHLSTIWNVLSIFGILFFISLSFGYIFLFLFPRKSTRLPLTIIKSIDISANCQSSKLRKQYDFLSKNGLLASGLNLFDINADGFANALGSNESMLQRVISSIMMDSLKDEIQSKKHLRELLAAFLRAKLNSQADGSTQGSNDLNNEIALLKTFLIDPVMKQVFEAYKAFADPKFYELLWLNLLMVFQEQIEIYKEMKHDYALTRPYESRHIDDFNDFSAETADESLKWSVDIDKMNQQILVRLEMSGKLHPAISKYHENCELDHLRKIFKNLMSFFRSKYSGFLNLNSNILDVAFREIIICKYIYPFIKITADPIFLNNYIMEKANRRILIQKGVKSFRTSLESSFSNFPPVFLISNYQAKRFSLHEKQKYVDLVLKYLKRATSAIDLSAVRHEAIKELKRKSDELAGTEQSEQDEDPEQVKRYIRSLQLLKRKLEKKLKNLESIGTDSFLGKSGAFHSFCNSHRYSKTPYLSLQTILDDFYKSESESGAMPSLSLYYFLEFLESKNEVDKSLHILRFSLAAERYKRMVWRVNTGIMGSTADSNSKILNSQSFDNLSKETHKRFQKEVQKIYNTFLKSSSFSFELPSDIIASFKRYIDAFTNASMAAEYLPDDYRCVIKAQQVVILLLDDAFDEFLHSDSYFKWARDVRKLRLLNTDLNLVKEVITFHAEYFEGSALMNNLENELIECCVKVTGKQSNASLSEEHLHSPSSIIVLEAEDFIQNSSELIFSPKDEDDEDEVHAPGELLGLSSKITHLQYSIDRLLQEIDRVNHLLSKPIRTILNQTNELFVMQKQILEQTKESLIYEIGELIRQKVKLESQEQKEALSPGQCTVTIKEVELNYANESVTGKKVTYFLIEIEQKHLKSGWAVKRRYNDFDALHRKLRVRFPIVDDFDFPGKSNVLWSMVRNEIKGARMKALELYLQRLIDNKDISKSDHVRNFLSSNYKPEPRRLFNFEFDHHDGSGGLKFTQVKLSETLGRLGVKKGTPDSHHSKMLGFLDTRRKSIENEDFDLNDHIDDEGDASQEDDIDDDEANPGIKGSGPLLESINKLVTQLFDFKEKNHWLLENASLYLLDGILGSKGFPEKCLKELIMDLISEERLSSFLSKCKNLSVLNQPIVTLRVDTKVKILAAFSELFSKKLGTELTARNLTMILEMLQSETLNKHILYTQLDSFIELLKNVL